MKSVIFFICLFIMIMSENLYGQIHSHTDEELVALTFRVLENQTSAKTLCCLGMEEGDKNKKNEKKRCLFFNTDFALPDNLTFIVEPAFLREFDKPVIYPDSVKIGNYVGIKEPLKFYRARIDSVDKKYVGTFESAYTASQYYARRMLVYMLSGTRNKPFDDKREVTFIDGIGDDYCIKYELPDSSSFAHTHILFIRDYTVFWIHAARPKNFDIEKLAKQIDQKFMELNKKLNE